MGRLCLYYVPLPEVDRWFAGDRHLRRVVRRVIRGRPRPGGIDKVFLNLRAGLDRLGVDYVVNRPFSRLAPSDMVGVLGRGRRSLEGYAQDNPIVAGVALMTHPSEWPTLFEDYPVVRYLQHSEWAADVYRPWFGDRCRVWPVGIDTDTWAPAPASAKDVDVLVYVKFLWELERKEREMLEPILRALDARGRSYRILRYGQYRPEQYADELARSRSMIFLSEHESQGIAYQECLSSGVPVLAWDQQRCLDPNRESWGQLDIPATSVPYWSAQCGRKFTSMGDFESALDAFLPNVDASAYGPREYILGRLTLERCAADYLEIVNAAQ